MAESKAPNRFSWLKNHPEDIPLDKENQEARKKYNDDALRDLCVAICRDACCDYAQSLKLNPTPSEDCIDFLNDDIFRYLFPRVKLEEAIEILRAAPKEAFLTTINIIKEDGICPNCGHKIKRQYDNVKTRQCIFCGVPVKWARKKVTKKTVAKKTQPIIEE